ncbi:MAG: heat-inducible transcription repressor HrcA [Clostridia bacterium]|nr:heat-inducible transcription repressor HrcA [Clostridia bacterium]
MIIENYIKVGIPVGSETVCRLMKNPPSSATVRNEMVLLSMLGLLEQPHVSSGRIPTIEGYRFYINYLMSEKKLSDYEKNYILSMFNDISYDPESIIKKACDVLSKIINCTVVFAVPPVFESVVKDIKFVKVGLRTVVLLLITSSGMIQNQVFNCSFEVNDSILNMFKMALSEFRGKSISSLNIEMDKILFARETKDIVMVPAFEAVFRAVKKSCQTHIEIKGEKFLFDFQDFQKAFEILDLFQTKKFADFIFSSINSLKIYLGSDSNMDVFSDCSIIVKKYDIGAYQGAIASIGPTRIDYSDITAKISYMAEVVRNMFLKIMSL